MFSGKGFSNDFFEFVCFWQAIDELDRSVMSDRHNQNFVAQITLYQINFRIRCHSLAKTALIVTNLKKSELRAETSFLYLYSPSDKPII